MMTDVIHNELDTEHGSMSREEVERAIEAMDWDGMPTEAEES